MASSNRPVSGGGRVKWWCSSAHIAPLVFPLPPTPRTPPPPLHLPPSAIVQVGIQIKNRLKDDNVALSLPSQVRGWACVGIWPHTSRALPSSGGLQGPCHCPPMKCSGLVGGQFRPAGCVALMPHPTSCPTARGSAWTALTTILPTL